MRNYNGRHARWPSLVASAAVVMITASVAFGQTYLSYTHYCAQTGRKATLERNERLSLDQDQVTFRCVAEPAGRPAASSTIESAKAPSSPSPESGPAAGGDAQSSTSGLATAQVAAHAVLAGHAAAERDARAQQLLVMQTEKPDGVQQTVDNATKATTLFRQGFEHLTSGNYADAREKFREGLNRNDRDVVAWLYYYEALWRVAIRTREKGRNDPDLPAIAEAQKEAIARIRELRPSDAQLAAVLVGFYGVYRKNFGANAPVAEVRLQDVTGKRICVVALPPHIKDYLQSTGSEVLQMDGRQTAASFRSFEGLCDIGLRSLFREGR